MEAASAAIPPKLHQPPFRPSCISRHSACMSDEGQAASAIIPPKLHQPPFPNTCPREQALREIRNHLIKELIRLGLSIA